MLGRKISVQVSVRAAFQFARDNTPKTAGVLSLILLFEIAAVLAPVSASISPALLALKGFEALFGVIAQGALYRLALAPAHGGDPDFRLGPLGLQWGKPETRLLGAHLLLFFLFFLGLLFWVMILIVTLGAGMFVSGRDAAHLGAAPLSPTPQQASQLLLASVPLILVALGVYVRICLYGVATVAERKVSVFSTWSLTRGNFWPILGAVFLIALPIGGLNVLATLPGEPRAATLVLELLSCVVDTFLVRPMYCGLFAYLYAAVRTSAPVETEGGAPRGPWG